MTQLQGKVALVTGSSRGIGRATALRLAREGASVVVNYSRSAEEAHKVIQEIEANGGQALLFQADVSKIADIQRLFDNALKHFGRLDIVIQNAGLSMSKLHSEVTAEDFEALFGLNARGTFFVLQQAAEHLQDGGRIVYVSSGSTVVKRAGGGVYGGSKVAGERFVQDLAMELGPRQITVNALVVGAVDTEELHKTVSAEEIQLTGQNTPLRRLGQPDDIADFIALLTTHDARWLTGAVIPLSGGLF